MAAALNHLLPFDYSMESNLKMEGEVKKGIA
jgi:hypothetical protein